MNLYLRKLAVLFALILAFVLGVPAQEGDNAPPKVGVAEIYLARDDGNGKAGERSTSFFTTDVPIHCVVQLDSSEPVTVKMNLVAVAVPGVKPETRVVSTTYTTKDLQDRVNFSGRPHGPWVAGLYRVDVFVGDAAVVSREFAIQKAVQAKPIPKPAPKPSDKSRLAGPIKKN